MRPTKRDIAQHILANMPEGRKPPEWCEKAVKRKASPGPRKHPEDDLQVLVYEYLCKLPGTLAWATPNHLLYKKDAKGGQINRMQRQKSMGLLPGASDLNILFKNKHGATVLCLAELKIKPNSPTPEQIAFMEKGNNCGAYTACCYSLNDVIALLLKAGHQYAY